MKTRRSFTSKKNSRTKTQKKNRKTPISFIQASNKAYLKTKNFNKARLAALKQVQHNVRHLFGVSSYPKKRIM